MNTNNKLTYEEVSVEVVKTTAGDVIATSGFNGKEIDFGW